MATVATVREIERLTIRRATPHLLGDEILAEVLACVESALGDQLIGMYVGGSLATGAFDPQTSDIDFLVVTRDEIDEKHERALQAAHARLTAGSSKWAKKLEVL